MPARVHIFKRGEKQSVPPRGSGWVRSQIPIQLEHWLRTHPLPRGGTDCFSVQSYNARRSEPHACRFSRCTGQISAQNVAPRSFDYVGVCGQTASSAIRARALFDKSDGRLPVSLRSSSSSQVSLLVTNYSLHHHLLSFNELNLPREIQTPLARHHSR